MFYLSYITAELRRRKGRTLLTALGLGVGVALVIAVTALSDGLDKAQEKVLRPLTGVGTDMSVTRPLKLGGNGLAGLSASERDRLRRENGGGRFGLRNLGKPGQRFETDDFATATQLSFPASEARRIAALPGARAAAAGLTLTAIHVSGRVPKRQPQVRQATPGGPPGGGGVQAPKSVNFNTRTVTGIDPAQPSLAAISPSQITSGRFLADDGAHEAVVNASYARREGIHLGDSLKLAKTSFTVVGIAKTPLGGQASDLYVKIAQLQALSGRKGRANVVYVRAESASAVGPLAKRIRSAFHGASVTTAKDLADRVGGSLVDAKNLAGKLGAALTIVGLAAAVLIASLLTLASVNKRIRELGTLNALGWPQRLVVRQVTGESLAQGVLGAIVGVALGIAAAAAITAVAPTLKASVAQAATGGGGPAGPVVGAFGQGQVAAGSTTVALDAPVDVRLIALAVALAVLGGLLAGAAGALRASPDP